MKFDWLLEPTETEPPAGPDLEAADDEDFVGRYFDAEGRLPERYFTPGLAADGSEDAVFDPQSVDFAAEAAWIGTLLRRSRDLRLLSLLARLAILSGRLEQFVETLEQIAALAEHWPVEVNPRMDSAPGERRAALEALNAQASVVMPLVHVSLIPGADVTLRRHLVATGRAEARASEPDLAVGADVLAPLRAEASRRPAAAVQALLSRALEALHRIGRAAAAHPAQPLRPDFGAVRASLADMQAMIAAAQPDLVPWAPAEAASEPDPPDAGESPAEADAAADPQPGAAPPVPVPDRATAVAALDAAEAWLAEFEPSSAAILLVTQARMLVGLPLIAAIEALLPDAAPQATLVIGRNTPFVLPMDRLKALSVAGLEARPAASPAAAALPPIVDRAGLSGTISGVEAYYHRHEPTSPVPILLARARDLLGRRFDAILAEMLDAAAEARKS